MLEMSTRLRLPSISFVVARSHPHNIIGRDNKLPWHQRKDLQRFKQITFGHPIIMGRSTFDSIGRPLPGRANIVVSKRPSNDPHTNVWDRSGATLLWSQSAEDAMYLADIIALSMVKEEFFVIGGEQMYKLYGHLCNRIHLTQIFAPIKPQKGDAIFEYETDGRQWQTLHEEEIPSGPQDDFPSRYTVLDRKFKTVRYVELEDFYTGGADRRKWVASQLDTITKSVAGGVQPHRSHQLHMFEETEATSKS
jgi:dihydrofolate reductase